MAKSIEESFHEIINTSYYSIYNDDKYTPIHNKCLKIIKSKTVTYADVIQLISWMCKGNKSKRSFFFQHSKMTLWLDEITLKFKLEKKEIKKLFTIIEKYYPTYKVNYNIMSNFSLKWIKNLEKMGVVFTIEQKNLLETIGYISSFNYLDGKGQIAFENLFSNIKYVTLIFENQLEFKECVAKNKFKLCIDHILYTLSYFSINNTEINYYTNMLTYFETLGYVYISKDVGEFNINGCW